MNNDISKITTVSLLPLSRNNDRAQKTNGNSEVKVDKSDKELKGNTVTANLGSKVTSLQEAKKLVEQGNKLLENVQRNLQFKLDETTKQIVLTVTDRKTGDIIKQVPSKELLALARQIQEAEGKPGGLIQGQA